MSAAARRYWTRRFARWPQPPPPVDGYSLLVPVPGDLPVFLAVALDVVGRLDAADRVETLVVPDAPSARVDALVREAAAGWPDDLRTVPLPLPERWLLRAYRNPSIIHPLQIIGAASRARGTHAVLHDADAFVLDAGFLRDRFRACRGEGLACLGVNDLWDPWFAAHGRRLAATWEMTLDLAWLRSFPPHLHMGRDDMLDGEAHTFDTTVYPQCHTPAERIRVEPTGAVVHFNYVISTYRHYQRSRRPFVDDAFRLLLIALLAELWSEPSPVPPPSTLAAGLTDPGARVSYAGPDLGPAYAAFRRRLAALLGSDLVTPAGRDRADAALAPFDEHFAAALAPA